MARSAPDFDTMACPAKVRRVSMSNIKWVWDWEEDEDRWRQYENSEELERRYLSGETTMTFSAGNHQYELRFSDMLQVNLSTYTARLMRRRPVFQNIPAKLDSNGIPVYWDLNLLPSVGYERIKLETSSPEYSTVLDLFNKTMPGWNIISIERIQNLHLWNFFKIQRDNMKAKAGKYVDERMLFHGTETQHVDAICHDNIDWRMCGKNGTVHGEGSYFARDAKYSNGYARDQGTKSMFVCRVLVGDFTMGRGNYRKPPYKDEQNRVAFDSCVNNMINPSIFVIFEKSQIYPEYLIQYEQYNEVAVAQPLRTAQAPPPLISTNTQTVPPYLASTNGLPAAAVQAPPYLASTNGLPAAAVQAPPYLASTNGLPAAAVQAPPYLASTNGLPAAAVQAPPLLQGHFQPYNFGQNPVSGLLARRQQRQQAAVQAPPPVVSTNAQSAQIPPHFISTSRIPADAFRLIPPLFDTNSLPAAAVQAPPPVVSTNGLPAAAVQASSLLQGHFQPYHFGQNPVSGFPALFSQLDQAAVQAPPPVVSTNSLPAAAVQTSPTYPGSLPAL